MGVAAEARLGQRVGRLVGVLAFLVVAHPGMGVLHAEQEPIAVPGRSCEHPHGHRAHPRGNGQEKILHRRRLPRRFAEFSP